MKNYHSEKTHWPAPTDEGKDLTTDRRTQPVEPQNVYSLTSNSILQEFQDDNFKFRHPFTMIVAGPTSCGKTTWVKALLEQSKDMITPPPIEIFWFYKRWQPLYSEMRSHIPHLKFVEGIQAINVDIQHPRLYIFDDLMRDCTKSTDICEMYTEGSHHQNLSVICLMQNLFHHGKENRTMNLNSQYIVLFKNPRDQ